MSEYNRRFVDLMHAGAMVPNYYSLRIDTESHTDICPVIYSPFWDDVIDFCNANWPGMENISWGYIKGAGEIWFKDPQHFMLLKLALSD